MLKNERLELGKVVRLRAKVAKGEVDKRIARCLADVEAQLAASYPINHEAWVELTREADVCVKRIRAVGCYFRRGCAHD